MNGDESILTISRSHSSVPGQGVTEGTRKNGHSRMVYLSKDMISILRSYCYQKMCKAQENGFEIAAIFFCFQICRLSQIQ